MSAPLVVNTKDGTCWTRRTVTSGGLALYAPEEIRTCPEFVMATEAELAEHKIAGSTFALPMPVAPEPQEDPVAAGRRLDLLALMDERAASAVSPVLAGVLDEAERLRASRWDATKVVAQMESKLLAMHGELTRATERVAELEAERHSTNESLDDAVQALREAQARLAELDADRRRSTAVPVALPPEQRATIAAHLADAKPATITLVAGLAKTVRDVREHEHPTREDLYCLNLVSYMGERMGPVLRRLLDAEARVAELEAAPTTFYRAEHPDSGITLGHYGTEKAARAHCEDLERRSWPEGTTLAFDWIEDDEDRVAELVVTAGQNEESTTGYVVTALELDSEYDPDGDE